MTPNTKTTIDIKEIVEHVLREHNLTQVGVHNLVSEKVYDCLLETIDGSEENALSNAMQVALREQFKKVLNNSESVNAMLRSIVNSEHYSLIDGYIKARVDFEVDDMLKKNQGLPTVNEKILQLLMTILGGRVGDVAPSITKVQMQLVKLIRDQVGNELAIRNAPTPAPNEIIHDPHNQPEQRQKSAATFETCKQFVEPSYVNSKSPQSHVERCTTQHSPGVVHHVKIHNSLWVMFVCQGDGTWRWQYDSDDKSIAELIACVGRSMQPTEDRIKSMRYALESGIRSASMMLGVNHQWMAMMDHINLFLIQWYLVENGK